MRFACRASARAPKDRARAQLAAVEADSLACLNGVVFLGGYTPQSELAKRTAYDLRFLG